MRARTIEVLSGVPSSGKTYTIRTDEIVNHLISEEHPGYIQIYVGLTHKLCREVYADLSKTLVGNMQAVAYLEDNPVNKFSYIMGMSTKADYLKTGVKKGSLLGITPSEVRLIICTHECFWRAPLVKSDTVNKSVVFFDEARDCVFNTSQVELSSSSIKNLQKAFVLMKPRGVDQEEVRKGETWVSRIYSIAGKDIPNAKDLAEAFKVKALQDVPSDVLKIYSLKESIASDRFEILISTEFPKEDKKELGDRCHIVGVSSPSRIFEGYGRVVVMSAYFEHSQMYSMLKHGHLYGGKHYELVPYKIKNHVFRGRDRLMTAKALKQIRIGALLEGEVKTVTSTMLSSGLLVPSKFNSLLKRSGCELSKGAIIKRAFEGRAFKSEALPKLNTEEIEYVNSALPRLGNPPALVLHRMAHHCFRKNGISKALCFFNARDSNSLAGSYFIGGRSKGRAPDIRVANLLGNLRSQIMDEGLPITDDMRKHLRHSLKTKMFEYPPLACHGLNEFSNVPAFVHIAGVNMLPATAKLLTRVFPGYDPELDKVISSIVQTGFRGIVRVEENTDPYYFMVGSEHLVKQVERVCFGGKELTRIEGWRPSWTVLDFVSQNIEAKAKGGTNKRKYTPEVAKLVQKAQIAMRQAKTEKTRRKWELEIKRLKSL